MEILEILKTTFSIIVYLIIAIFFIRVISLVAEKSKTINWISGKIIKLLFGRENK